MNRGVGLVSIIVEVDVVYVREARKGAGGWPLLVALDRGNDWSPYCCSCSRFLRLLDRIETKAAADDVDGPGLTALLNEFQPVLVGALRSVIRCQEW